MNEVKGPQPSDEARLNVKSQVAKMLIDAMERGDTPWQRPWKAQGSSPMSAKNKTTGNAYRGVNRILLALAGTGYGSNDWMTYQQAAAQGWNVRKGEKGSMIVKVVDLSRNLDGGEGAARPEGAPQENAGGKESEQEKSAGHALKRYWVFNAEQVEGMPQVGPEPSGKLDVEPVEPVERAEAIMEALKEKTGLLVIHGGDKVNRPVF